MSWLNSGAPGVPGPSVLLADRSPLYREGLKIALAESSAYCREVNHFDELVATARACMAVDMLVLDERLPGFQSLTQLQPLQAEWGTAVLLLTERASDDPVGPWFDGAVQGIVSKSAPLPVLAEALLTVLEGGYWLPDRSDHADAVDSEALAQSLRLLSVREQRVLSLMTRGLSNKAIGRQLRITENTVKSHVARIYRKVDMDNRTLLALAVQALPHQLVAVDGRNEYRQRHAAAAL